jgi:hypothetical protein
MAVSRQVKQNSQGLKSKSHHRRPSSIVYDPDKEKLSIESIPDEKLIGKAQASTPNTKNNNTGAQAILPSSVRVATSMLKYS